MTNTVNNELIDERFESYLTSLLNGETVTVAADDRYTDFLRYVQSKGKEMENKFEKCYQRKFRDVPDPAIPTVVNMWLEQ